MAAALASDDSDPGIPTQVDPTAAIPAPPAIEGAQALRFIGLVEVRERPDPVAVLADGDDVHHGLENDVIEGRYRILAIASMSVEVEDMVRGARMTLRLSGAGVAVAK